MNKKTKYINFSNPYSCRYNWFIRIYKLTQYRAKQPLSSISFLLSILFNRFAFALVSNKLLINTTAYIYNKRFTMRSTNSQFHSIYFYDKCYEPEVYAAIDIFLPLGGVFVDVGSNWGHHTFIAALSKKAKVYAFEPNCSVYRDLTQIAKDLNCEDKVAAFNVGVGSSQHKTSLIQFRFESGIASVSDDFLKKRLDKSVWLEKIVNLLTFHKPIKNKIDVVKLDGFLPDGMNIDLIKIDAEGFEFDVLQGMTLLLTKQRPAVLFELHTDVNGHFKRYSDFFNNLNYRLFEIVTNLDSNECSFILVNKLKPSSQYNLLATKVIDI